MNCSDDLAEFVTILHARILNADTIARRRNPIFIGCLHSNLEYFALNSNKMSTIAQIFTDAIVIFGLLLTNS